MDIMTQTSTTATEMDIKDRVVRVLQEFTKASRMGSITTGMLTLLIKPNCTNHEFESLLDSMEEEGILIGIPKGKTKRWKLD